MLVIDYSCGIKLSTATAFSAAINTAVKQRRADQGRRVYRADEQRQHRAAGQDRHHHRGQAEGGLHAACWCTTWMSSEVLSLAMAAEETSTHPLASAILAYGRELGAEIPVHGEIVTEVSRGSRTDVDGQVVRVGNLKYMAGKRRARAEEASQDACRARFQTTSAWTIASLQCSSPWTARATTCAGPSTALRYDGVGDIEMLTGDMERAGARRGRTGRRGRLSVRSCCRSRRPRRCSSCRRRATAW